MKIGGVAAVPLRAPRIRAYEDGGAGTGIMLHMHGWMVEASMLNPSLCAVQYARILCSDTQLPKSAMARAGLSSPLEELLLLTPTVAHRVHHKIPVERPAASTL